MWVYVKKGSKTLLCKSPHRIYLMFCTSNSQNTPKKLYYITLIAESASYCLSLLLKWTVAEIWKLYIQGFTPLWGPKKPFKRITGTPRKSLDLIYIHLSPGFLPFPCKAHKSWLYSKRKLEWLNNHSLGRDFSQHAWKPRLMQGWMCVLAAHLLRYSYFN